MDDTLLKQARQLNLRNGGKHCVIPPIVLMTDDVRLPDPEAAIRALPTDSMVVFRHYDHPERAILGAKLRSLCRARGILFLVANNLSLALKLNADGIHLPEYRIIRQKEIYRQVPQNMLVTAACHRLQTLHHLKLLARHQRPDGILVSPAFVTQSHPGRSALERANFVKFSVQIDHLKIGAIALGGIKPDNIRHLRRAPICAIAGISFVINRS